MGDVSRHLSLGTTGLVNIFKSSPYHLLGLPGNVEDGLLFQYFGLIDDSDRATGNRTSPVLLRKSDANSDKTPSREFKRFFHSHIVIGQWLTAPHQWAQTIRGNQDHLENLFY